MKIVKIAINDDIRARFVKWRRGEKVYNKKHQRLPEQRKNT